MSDNSAERYLYILISKSVNGKRKSVKIETVLNPIYLFGQPESPLKGPEDITRAVAIRDSISILYLS
jgi:hypothetical protein